MSAHPESDHVRVPRAGLRPVRRSVLLALGTLVALGAAAWVLSLETREIDVQVVAPVRQDISSKVASSGVLVPVHDYPVRANFGGLVEKLYVHVGQNVRAGEMLVKMKDQYADSRLDRAYATLQESESNLQNAEQNGTQDDRIAYAAELARDESDRDNAAAILVSLQKLEKRGSVSEAEVLNGARQLKQAEISLNALRGHIAHRYSAGEIRVLQAKLRENKDELSAERVSWANANISSPISGTVYNVPVLPYDFVPAGAELMHVADLHQFEIRANFFEGDLSKLHDGEQATIQWEGDPGKTWSGKLISSPMAVDRNGPVSVGHCIILLTSSRDGLPIDSDVTVAVETEKRSNVMTIPHRALHDDGQGSFVYTLSGGRLRKTPVSVGLVNEMTVEIIRGLTERDHVVIQAADGSTLRDGRRARIINPRQS